MSRKNKNKQVKDRQRWTEVTEDGLRRGNKELRKHERDRTDRRRQMK